MGARGPQSVERLALAAIGPSGLEVVHRPEPPLDLSDEQTVEWRDVVNRLPADWFGRETHALLVQYCRHVVAAKRVAQLVASIEADPEFNIANYDKALKMQEREGRAIAALATKMRIAQQSTYDKSKRKPAAGRKPWEG